MGILLPGKVMDDYSRFISGWKDADGHVSQFLIEVIQQAVDATGMTNVACYRTAQTGSRIMLGYVSRAFNDYLPPGRHFNHNPLGPFHPQTNEK